MNTRIDSKQTRGGIILLVVLGMLALFALLAITFVALSGQSLKSSNAFAKAKLRQPDPRVLSDMILRQVLRGSSDPNSAFTDHSLLDDVYGPTPIFGQFRAPAELATLPDDGIQLINNTYLKLPLNPLNATGTATVLAAEDNAYNGRLFTFLAGPLVGNSFHIMHYCGATRSNGTTRVVADPDFSLRYSIILNVSEFAGKTLTAKTAHGEISRTLEQWVSSGPNSQNSLGYDTSLSGNYSGVATYIPYRFLINDAVFNGVGRGMVFDTTNTNHGNLGDLVSLGPSLPSIPSGILHRGETYANWRQGGTNEGVDVPDYRDQFLFYRPTTSSGTQDIIPSFHRPEVIGYIANLYGNPSSWTSAEAAVRVPRMLAILDLACARPLSQRLLGISGSNVYFTGGNTSNPQVSIDLSNWGAGEANKLQAYVAWLMEGPWDVDNDGDGIPDSMWQDPNLPTITTADGKIVKVLVAPQIEDMDGRLNINTGGDLAQFDVNWAPAINDAFAGFSGVTPVRLGQGFGYGPAEVSFSHLLNLGNYGPGASPFHIRNGADGVPGVQGPGRDDDTISNFFQRGIFSHHRHGFGGLRSGLPLARRGGFGMGIDRFGNPILLNNTFGPSVPSETDNDPYEQRTRSPSPQDTLYTLTELEKVLRRYDASQALLPRRLQDVLGIGTGVGSYNVNSIVNRVITTRSAEIRSPIIATPNASSPSDLLEWARQLYQARYFQASDPPAMNADLSPANRLAFRTLFSTLLPREFRLGKKLNLNRPFGDGVDNDGDGDIDDPQELATTVQTESLPGGGSMAGDYTSGFVGSPARLGSRQLLARQLYCLANLIVPRNHQFPGTAGLSATDAALRRARILAQWSVNIVDFRDEDAVMTRFEYDPFPFGNGATSKPPGWDPSFGGAVGNVVWGYEFQELSLTESIAMHDLRSRDTDQDNGSGERMTGTDMTRDQFRIPQGSLFLELYNLRTTSGLAEDSLPAAPASLYVNDGGVMKLNLGKTAPVSGVWGAQPVWRVGLSNAEVMGTSPNELLQANAGNPAATAVSGLTFQTSKATAAASGLQYDRTGARPQIDFDRFIWFTDPATIPAQIPNLASETDANRAYRVFRVKNTTTPYLEGGSYAVIGPRQLTYIGSQTSSASTPVHLPSPQRIELTTGGITTYKLDATAESVAGGSTKPVLGLIAATDTPDPATWGPNLVVPADGLYGVGLNVSEPLSAPTGYYPRPQFRLNNADMGNNSGSFTYRGFLAMPPDGYKDYTGSSKTLPDVPFDEDPAINTILTDPMSPKNTVGTYPNFKTAYLQRLADPDIGYDPVENPYITVDWISIDLTVFNGEDAQAPTSPVAFQTRYKDGADSMHLSASAAISSTPPPATQRTTVGTTVMSYSTSTLVTTPVYTGPTPASPPTTAAPYFNYQLGNSDATNTFVYSASTLGRLNTGRPLVAGASLANQFDGFGPTYNSVFNNLDGSSTNTLASLFWFNRQYASPFELMLVTPAGPAEVNRMMTFANPASPYAQAAATLSHPFGQSINMFDTSTMKTDNSTNASGPYTPYWMKGIYNAGTGTDTPLTQADLHLMLELLETPSPYADSGVVLTPNSISTAPALIQTTMLSNYLPPNNFLSSYVAPGKVNINTIPGEEVWKGVELNFLRGTDRTGATGNTNWSFLLESRRGYAAPVPANAFFSAVRNPNLHPLSPTQFGGAFSSPFLSNIAPVLPPSSLPLRKPNSVATSLMRPASPSVLTPLMGSAYPNGDRQPFAAYQRMMRLPNLVSQQSNVFAVRMTIGFFEFDPSTGLGEEYIGFGGEAKRHRAFYIIDRSIPVGYRPGEDINTENTVLLRRIVE